MTTKASRHDGVAASARRPSPVRRLRSALDLPPAQRTPGPGGRRGPATAPHRSGGTPTGRRRHRCGRRARGPPSRTRTTTQSPIEPPRRSPRPGHQPAARPARAPSGRCANPRPAKRQRRRRLPGRRPEPGTGSPPGHRRRRRQARATGGRRPASSGTARPTSGSGPAEANARRRIGRRHHQLPPLWLSGRRRHQVAGRGGTGMPSSDEGVGDPPAGAVSEADRTGDGSSPHPRSRLRRTDWPVSFRPPPIETDTGRVGPGRHRRHIPAVGGAEECRPARPGDGGHRPQFARLRHRASLPSPARRRARPSWRNRSPPRREARGGAGPRPARRSEGRRGAPDGAHQT